MFSFRNIYDAHIECRKNKSNTANALAFEVNHLDNLWALHKELNERTYKPSRSICFFSNTPKLREIFAADFKDRVVHHLLVRSVNDHYEKKMIFDVYMNRFDHFIKRDLKIKYYARYVDDFILLGTSKNELLDIKTKISKYLLINLKLNLKDDYKVKRINPGADFLGYIISPNYTLVRKRVVNNFKLKKAKFLTMYEKYKGRLTLDENRQFMSIQASFIGHCKHADSYNKKSRRNI